MKKIAVNIENATPFVEKNDLAKFVAKADQANAMLHNGSGKGADFLGWIDLPSTFPAHDIQRINDTANRIREISDVVVVVGIGGSYLGAKAVFEALRTGFPELTSCSDAPQVVFAGQNISEDYMFELLNALKGKDFSVVVISKSGTTTEPAIAFRLLKRELTERYGREASSSRIIAITDKQKGALKTVADTEGYETFVIPDDIGGRYSVLTPVGLVPLAIAGIDITQLLAGAIGMQQDTDESIKGEVNPAVVYASIRNMLYDKGYYVEILASYEPKLQYIAEWWKQLYGESEGKSGKGIFPASVTLTSDLHSMGQYIQEGKRILFETVINVSEVRHELAIPRDDEDGDGLNFIAGRRLSDINHKAGLGVMLAHTDGGVPNIVIDLPRIDEYNLGALIYLFEKACGISGYMLGVNPFDQPGVEAYKKNMFALLDKPGFEKEAEELKERLKK